MKGDQRYQANCSGKAQEHKDMLCSAAQTHSDKKKKFSLMVVQKTTTAEFR